MRKLISGKIGLILGLIIIVIIYKSFELGQYLSLEGLKTNQVLINNYYAEEPALTVSVFFIIYILTTALSIPGATILTLAGGAVFGFFKGTLLVSFASTIGASLAFFGSRFLLRDFIQSKFSHRIRIINEGIKKEGAFYLFTLRLIPLVPFFLVNLVMGVTSIRPLTFYVVSQFGMLAGTIVYVNAGTQLAQIESLMGIFSPGLVLSFLLMGLLPLASKCTIGSIKANKYLKM